MRSALVLVLLLLACPATALAADRVTFGVSSPTALDWDSFVAHDRGFFAKQDLSVEATSMAPDLPVKALLAGTVDVAKSGTHFPMIAAARGADVKIVAGSVYGYPYDVISQPHIQSLVDLRGQTIAGANPASITTVIFKELMARQGIAPRQSTRCAGSEAAASASWPCARIRSRPRWPRARRSICWPWTRARRCWCATAIGSRTCSTRPISRRRSSPPRVVRSLSGSSTRWARPPAG